MPPFVLRLERLRWHVGRHFSFGSKIPFGLTVVFRGTADVLRDNPPLPQRGIFPLCRRPLRRRECAICCRAGTAHEMSEAEGTADAQLRTGMGIMCPVSRVSPVQTAVRNCTRDEGGPSRSPLSGLPRALVFECGASLQHFSDAVKIWLTKG